MLGLILIGEPAVVVLVGEERLVVAKEHEHDGAVELAQLANEVLERAVGFLNEGQILVDLVVHRAVDLLIGEPAVVVLVGEEWLVVAKEHEHDGAVELAQLANEVLERAVGFLN